MVAREREEKKSQDGKRFERARASGVGKRVEREKKKEGEDDEEEEKMGRLRRFLLFLRNGGNRSICVSGNERGIIAAVCRMFAWMRKCGTLGGVRVRLNAQKKNATLLLVFLDKERSAVASRERISDTA